MSKLKKKNAWVKYLPVIIAALIIPLVIGFLVSTPAFFNLATSNNWIDFWGGYAGSIIGGVITLIVMKTTLSNNVLLAEKEKRQNLCIQVSHLVSTFCIEMLAYRGKWKSLHSVADAVDSGIDQIEKIERGATTE